MGRVDYFYFVIDISDSMSGNKIGAVNDAVNNIIFRLRRVLASKNFAGKITILTYSEYPEWSNPVPVNVDAFVYNDLQTSGKASNLGEALYELNEKLCRQEAAEHSSDGITTIIYFTDGLITDDFGQEIERINSNIIYQKANVLGVTFSDELSVDIAKNLMERIVSNTNNIIIDDFVKLNKVIFEKYK